MTAPAKLLTLDKLRAHTAYRNAKGQKIPGVTTVLGMIDKSFALTRWAWQLGRDGIDLDAARDQAMTTGSIAHALCEAYVRGMELDRSNLAPNLVDAAETSFLAFLSFWDREQLTPLASEVPMVSESLGCGGTMDLVAQRPNGKILGIDMKAAKGLFPEHFTQLAVYCHMWTETHGQEIDEAFVVRIPKDPNDNLEVVQVHQRAERVEAFRRLLAAREALLRVGFKL